MNILNELMVGEELTCESSSMDQVLLWILWTVDIYQKNDLFELQANLANQLGPGSICLTAWKKSLNQKNIVVGEIHLKP